MFYEMGQNELAVTLLCQSKAAKRFPPGFCAYARPVASDTVTHAELDQVFRRTVAK